MTRLYWRIFLSFWAVIVLTTLIAFALSALLWNDRLASTRFELMRGSFETLAAQAQDQLPRGGEPALASWLAKRQASLPLPLLVIAPGGRELLGRPLPPGAVRFLARRAARADQPGPGPARRGPPVKRLQAADGRSYLLTLPAHRPRFGAWFPGPAGRALYALVLLLVSGLVCFLLARYLVRPVRALRHAGQRIAAGDLTARAGERARARRDELGDLARDFDSMADRVQHTLESQQRLLRDVSHELRSPLARLQAAAGLLHQRAGGAEDDNLVRIDKEVQRLDELIGRILDYSRVSSPLQLEPAQVDLGELVGDIVADAEYEGRLLGRTVHFQAESSPVLRADRQLLRSAIENVVRNGLHHARARLQVSLHSRPAGGAVIRVVDDGPGVPEEALHHLAEPFYAGRDGGAGVGLAIAAAAMELHGGRLALANAREGGLRVELELPADGLAMRRDGAGSAHFA